MKVLVVTVVNAVGAVVDRNGHVLRCTHPVTGDCGAIAERIGAHLATLGAAKLSDAEVGNDVSLTANTTISVVVTNQTLPHWALQRLAIQVQAGAGREVEVADRGSLYLPADEWVPLLPVGKDEFELGTPRGDRLRFERDARGHVMGIIINPGPWPIRAGRLGAEGLPPANSTTR